VNESFNRKTGLIHSYELPAQTSHAVSSIWHVRDWAAVSNTWNATNLSVIESY